MISTQIYRHNVIRETEKAILVGIDREAASFGRFDQTGARHTDRVSEVWLPKSQIGWQQTVYGEELLVAKWLAKKL